MTSINVFFQFKVLEDPPRHFRLQVFPVTPHAPMQGDKDKNFRGLFPFPQKLFDNDILNVHKHILVIPNISKVVSGPVQQHRGFYRYGLKVDGNEKLGGSGRGQ